MIKLRTNPLLPTTYHLPFTNSGFTIIELVIVITIMAILLTLGVVNVRGSQANGRDAERKTDIEAIAQHLETYYTSGTDTSNPSLCTGGTITHSGLYTFNTFTTNGSLVCTGTVTAQVLVVGGGGQAGWEGGGGAGGVLYNSSLSILAGSYGVTVGSSGASSVFGAFMTTLGGGTGGRYGSPNGIAGSSGGSGGGGGSTDGAGSGGAGGSGTAGQGYAGGAGIKVTGNGYPGGGGGGAGGVGADGASNKGGDGGVGVDYSSIFGTNVGQNGWFGGGGGGTILYAPLAVRGSGGNGGGGQGGQSTAGNDIGSSSGLPNTGGGGGGSEAINDPGGSGIVIIRYLTVAASNTYPNTTLMDTLVHLTATLRDIDTDSLMAPGVTDPMSTFTLATCSVTCIQTTAGVTPQPTKDQYVYQPLHTDGSLCNDNAECSKFNLYYRTEVDNTVQMVSSIDQ